MIDYAVSFYAQRADLHLDNEEGSNIGIPVGPAKTIEEARAAAAQWLRTLADHVEKDTAGELGVWVEGRGF